MTEHVFSLLWAKDEGPIIWGILRNKCVIIIVFVNKLHCSILGFSLARDLPLCCYALASVPSWPVWSYAAGGHVCKLQVSLALRITQRGGS